MLMHLFKLVAEVAAHLAPLAEVITDHGFAHSSWYASYIDPRPPAFVSTALATFSCSCRHTHSIIPAAPPPPPFLPATQCSQETVQLMRHQIHS